MSFGWVSTHLSATLKSGMVGYLDKFQKVWVCKKKKKVGILQGGKGGEGHFLGLVNWRWNHRKELPVKQCLVILHSGKVQMPEMLWDQAFEGRRSPKTILSTDNKRLSWRICLWGFIKTQHIHLLLLSKCWSPGEAYGLWTLWPHRILGP